MTKNPGGTPPPASSRGYLSPGPGPNRPKSDSVESWGLGIPMIFRIGRFLIRLFYRLIARVTVVGAEHIPVAGGIVAVTNHVGRLDVGLPYYLVDRADLIIIVAEKYRKYAVARALARVVDGIWVDRFNADLAAVRACLRRLANGGALVIAPEGTRSASGNLIRARSGASFLAAKAGVPIVPVAIRGTEDAVVKAHLKQLRRLEIVVRLGKPFHLPARADLRARARLEAFDDEIMCRIAALLPADRRGAYADHPRLRELLEEG